MDDPTNINSIKEAFLRGVAYSLTTGTEKALVYARTINHVRSNDHGLAVDIMMEYTVMNGIISVLVSLCDSAGVLTLEQLAAYAPEGADTSNMYKYQEKLNDLVLALQQKVEV